METASMSNTLDIRQDGRLLRITFGRDDCGVSDTTGGTYSVRFS